MIRFSSAEHRLLGDLAGARGVSIETLVREALSFAPIGAQSSPVRRLRVVRGDDAPAASDGGQEQSAPSG